MGENVQTTAFEYDHLGRLGMATTSFAGTAGNQYSVSTSYNKAGGILEKESTTYTNAKVYAATSQDMNYNLIYTYSKSKPHQLEDVISSVGAPYAMAFSYNTSGSISEITDMTGSDNSSFYWGQEQWLCGVQNAQGIHHYVYDHAGERVMKSSITQTTVQLNDQTINTVSTLEPYTLYVNPYYVITAFSNADRKSKHYYMGTQRVATDIGVEYWASPTPQESTGGRDNTTKVGTTSSGTSSAVQSQGYLDDLQRVIEQLSEGLEVADVTMTSTPIESFYPELVQESAAAESTESEPPVYSGSRILYWYHPDYVSNVDLVTDRTGEAYELFLYNAWGESLHHWTSSSSNMWSSPYRFNSKELDPETGMHYYGARYHHPKISVWMSVDPKANEVPSWSPYNYMLNNPINLIDPDGRAAISVQNNPIPSIIPVNKFVGWQRPGIPFFDSFHSRNNRAPECLDYAKEQMRVVGTTAGGAMTSSNMYTYDEKKGANSGVAEKAVNYMMQAIDAGKPVLVGVDIKPGSPNSDKTTDHFVVIVGYQSNEDGSVSFRFFDNASGSSTLGANENNVLIYDPRTGVIKGQSQTSYGQHYNEYRVSQVRVTETIGDQ